jgi:hypothetical protein
MSLSFQYLDLIYYYKHIMNMLIPHRRSGRRRQAPKRFEDEKFVSGRVDQYTRGYEGRDSNWGAAEEDAENYYHTRKGRKFANYVWNGRGKYRVQLRDFPESLLELASIWRDLDMVLPSAIISNIGEFLRFSQTDQDLLVDDDEFIAGDESESENEEQDKKWSCSGLPMEDEEWSSASETDESDYDSDALYDSD